VAVFLVFENFIPNQAPSHTYIRRIVLDVRQFSHFSEFSEALKRRFFSTGGKMQATVKWLDGVAFVGESGSGHSFVLDGDPTSGGRNIGVRPMEAILIGMGACAAFDVVTILKKSRADVVDCWVELEADRAETIPKVFARINMHFVVVGRSLKVAQVERAVQLSATKYCSATAMMEHTAKVTFDTETREF
jgi:putative redox protein